jgi:hypothetical protein
MEVITTIFDQLEEDIHTRLRVLEKQIVFMLAQNQRGSSGNTEAIDFLENKVHSMTDLVSMLEQRIRSLEARPVHVPVHVPTQMPLSFNERSAGLEGLVIKPSPVLSAISVSNSVVLPTIQRTVILNEEVEEEVDVDEEAEKEMVAERQGGLTVEEEDEAEEEAEVEEEEEEQDEDEEQEEVEEEGEDEVEEELQLEEFTWKGKTYYKDQNENVYRMVEEGVPEDEPFATYDPTNNKLTRIS